MRRVLISDLRTALRISVDVSRPCIPARSSPSTCHQLEIRISRTIHYPSRAIESPPAIVRGVSHEGVQVRAQVYEASQARRESEEAELVL
jgi:hypothetical protein